MELSVKRSSDGEWTEIDRQVTNAKEGYLFITGDPSSGIDLHIIADTEGRKYTTEINDSTYRKEATDDMNERFFFGEILTETPPDGCYAVTVQDVK